MVVVQRGGVQRALCVIAQSAAVALRLAPGRGDRRVFLSYAEQVPVAAQFASLAFWMADAYAARLHAAGLAPTLAAPGWDWLSSIDPALTGRQVVSTTMDQLPDAEVFVKPALIKLVGAPAGVWQSDAFRAAALAEGADEAMRVQYCRQVLALDDEHRFVVREGEVLTGSPYRVGGRSWHRSLTSQRSDQAAAFAASAVRALGDDCPVVCSLDVAYDHQAQRWVVVEANPLWASGPYGCDARLFVDAVEHANTAGTGRWAWRPEATQLARAHAHPPMVARPLETATGYAELAT